MLTLEVKDFGPIGSGRVELKPLTIFVGPNNTGKSYLAMLTYAVHHASFGMAHPYGLPPRIRGYPFFGFPFQTGKADELLKSEEGRASVKAWLAEHQTRPARSATTSIGALPAAVVQAFDEVTHRYFESYAADLGTEISRCFGAELSDLTRGRRAGQKFLVRAQHTDPQWDLTLGLDDGKLHIDQASFDFSQIEVEFGGILPPRTRMRPPRSSMKGEELDAFSEFLLEQSFSRVYRLLFPDSYYLPAARSGIQQSHKALAGFLVSRSSLIGIERFPDVPQLSGVVVDFISSLLRLEQRRKSKLESTAVFLEREAIEGTITFNSDKLSYPELYYQGREAGPFPLFRTSSMVSELAPVVLFLRHIVDPTNLLIIEEPESHLHPEIQRKMARALVKLVRARVNVLITTHSDYLLEQISNFIRLGLLDSSERSRQGYDEQDFLRPEDVGVYLFQDQKDGQGTKVQPLPLDAEHGIPDPEFQNVAEALYQETAGLQRRLLVD